MTMRTVILLSCLTILILTPIQVETQSLLPDSVCNFCEGIFRVMGCLTEGTTACRILALKFQVVLNGQRLCTKFLCEPVLGAPDIGHTCKGQLQCLFNKRSTDGICPLNQVCCAP